MRRFLSQKKLENAHFLYRFCMLIHVYWSLSSSYRFLILITFPNRIIYVRFNSRFDKFSEIKSNLDANCYELIKQAIFLHSYHENNFFKQNKTFIKRFDLQLKLETFWGQWRKISRWVQKISIFWPIYRDPEGSITKFQKSCRDKKFFFLG